MCTSEVADLEMQDIFTDIFPVRQRERMSATVMNLLEELLEKIILLLDPASAINFSLCATRIHGLLSNHITFLRILDTVQFKVADNNEDVEAKAQRTEDNQELVDNIRNFICTTADPGPLLARLQEIISLQFPSKGLVGTWENKDAGTWDWMGDGAIVLEAYIRKARECVNIFGGQNLARGPKLFKFTHYCCNWQFVAIYAFSERPAGLRKYVPLALIPKDLLNTNKTNILFLMINWSK